MFRKLTQALVAIHGEDLAFRPLALTDTGPLFEATRNKAFNRYLLWPQPRDRAEMAGLVGELMREAEAGRICALSGVNANDGRWLFLFRFVPFFEDPAEVEYGVWLHPCAWDGHTSIRATRLALDAAFACTPMARIHAAGCARNGASIRLMRSCGMSEIERPPTLRPTAHGDQLETRTFVLTRQAWQASREKPAFTAWHARLQPESPAADAATGSPAVIQAAVGPEDGSHQHGHDAACSAAQAVRTVAGWLDQAAQAAAVEAGLGGNDPIAQPQAA